MANRFHPLMATMAIVNATLSSSGNWRLTVSYKSSGTSFSEIRVSASVQARAARSRSGDYLNMRGQSIADWNRPIDELFVVAGSAAAHHRPVTVGVGDGGNEIGMGNVRARLAEAGGLTLRIFNRDGKKILGQRRPDPAAYPDGNHDLMLEFLNPKDGAEWASVPVVVVYSKEFVELHRYIEYPAIYHKDRIRGHQQAARPGESPEQARERGMREFAAMQASPFFDLWASAGVDEILSALHEKRVVS